MAETLPIIAIVAKTKRKLKETRATSENTAKTPKELGLPEKWLKIPGVKKTKDGRYYLELTDKKHC
jgi:hypothetical protein